MIFSPSPDTVPFAQPSVVTVGAFDGVHKAHQQIVETVVAKAKAVGGRSVLVSFDPHPQNVLRPEAPVGLLTTMAERRDLCEALGIDVFCVVPFTYEFSRTPWETFLKDVLVGAIGATEIVEGFNHHFGKDREGSVEAIRSAGKALGFGVTALDPVLVDGIQVSSTKIRHALLDGDVGRAGRFLGRPYTFSGTVVHGEKRGATLGYPTANIVPDADKKLVPANGIYVVSVRIGETGLFHGLASIGYRPTFHDDGPRTIEVYILDHASDLYGKKLNIGFLRRLRGELKFDSTQDLIRQMDKDKEEAIAFLSSADAS